MESHDLPVARWRLAIATMRTCRSLRHAARVGSPGQCDRQPGVLRIRLSAPSSNRSAGDRHIQPTGRRWFAQALRAKLNMGCCRADIARGSRSGALAQRAQEAGFFRWRRKFLAAFLCPCPTPSHRNRDGGDFENFLAAARGVHPMGLSDSLALDRGDPSC